MSKEKHKPKKTMNAILAFTILGQDTWKVLETDNNIDTPKWAVCSTTVVSHFVDEDSQDIITVVGIAYLTNKGKVRVKTGHGIYNL